MYFGKSLSFLICQQNIEKRILNLLLDNEEGLTKSFGDISKWTNLEGSNFRQRKPLCKKTVFRENVRRCLVSTQGFNVNLDTADKEKGMESRDIKGLND